ncbi:hypothetical protein MJO29_015418 [Puccinia striiformis f. sp. tritici]|uniref:Uncharacterized protein n=1 Tax=Puccinia striiformis f. sp. tritici PST-78 TaxID=1165861 RepID=A0A0L0VCQ9_9BASI|nr:hypothetical protein MJO29_015418 [Puccinia striiformis f. sp. tritici]KAI9617264.1 hypothetical protein H4Q26_013133 [Puccinia striiformis f. sp. tritici PST-130]KNE97082.1 hypothetical protein PSTG_09656 [Puccinia striiformis f. sp. tritici PST-78]
MQLLLSFALLISLFSLSLANGKKTQPESGRIFSCAGNPILVHEVCAEGGKYVEPKQDPITMDKHCSEIGAARCCQHAAKEVKPIDNACDNVDGA